MLVDSARECKSKQCESTPHLTEGLLLLFISSKKAVTDNIQQNGVKERKVHSQKVPIHGEHKYEIIQLS